MLKRTVTSGAVVGLLHITIAAKALELPAPEVEAKEITAGGTLIGCSLEFVVTFRDQVYQRGAPAGATGSINLWHREKKLYSSLKIVGVDFTGSGAERFKIAHSTLFDADGHPIRNVASGCENPNDFCAVMPADAFLNSIMSIANNGYVRLAFNRHKGGLDVPIQLQANPSILEPLLGCAKRLSVGAD